MFPIDCFTPAEDLLLTVWVSGDYQQNFFWGSVVISSLNFYDDGSLLNVSKETKKALKIKNVTDQVMQLMDRVSGAQGACVS